jgi:hypothetical protein
MKMRGWTGVLILLCAGLAQAVNTTATLHDKSWVQSQQGLIGYVDSPSGNAAQVPDPNLKPSASNGGLLGPMLENEAELPAVWEGDPTASVHPMGDAVASWANDPRWSVAVKNGGNADFLDASSRVELPAFADIDWMADPLPTAKKTSLMEIVVFPVLGMLVLVLLVTWLVLRIRRHKPVSQEQQLLHV